MHVQPHVVLCSPPFASVLRPRPRLLNFLSCFRLLERMAASSWSREFFSWAGRALSPTFLGVAGESEFFRFSMTRGGAAGGGGGPFRGLRRGAGGCLFWRSGLALLLGPLLT